MQSKNLLLQISRSQAAATRLAKSVSLSDLEKALKHLQLAKQALKKQEAEKAEKLRAKNLKKLKSMMDELGLSAKDVRNLTSEKRSTKRGRPKKAAAGKKTNPRKGKKIAPKYSIKVGKETHKWTGRGRTPQVFKDLLEKGGSLEQCLIK